MSADGTPAIGVLVVVNGTGHLRQTFTDSNGHYSIPLSELAPPYFVEAGGLHSAVLQAGVADVTPLTELAFLEIVQQDTHRYFLNLDTTLNNNGEPGDGSSDRSLFTATSLAQGQVDALRFIASIYGLAPVTGTGDFFRSGFSAMLTDPMAETIKAYNNAVVASGVNYSILQQTMLCALSKVVVTRATDSVDFCQFSAKAEADGGNTATTVYTFLTQSQDRIVLKAQDVQVLSVDYTPNLGGGTFSCAGSACADVVLGTPGSDGNRPLIFTGTVLTNAVASVTTLSGNLVAGTTFPPLLCTGSPFYLRQNGDYTGGDCVTSIYGNTSFGRAIYNIGTNAVVGFLEVRMDGDRIVSVLNSAQGFDSGGNYTTLAKFKCRFTACANFSLSEPDADGNRTMVLNGTLLFAVLPDGSLSTTESEQLDATLVLPPVPPPYEGTPCPDAPFAVFNFEISGYGASSICLPDSTIAYSGGVTHDDGSIDYVFSNGATLDVTATGTVVQAVTLAYELFRCLDASCGGTTVSGVSPDNGKRTVTLDSQVLTEIETGGLIGDRTAVVSGSGVTPSETCILTGVCP